MICLADDRQCDTAIREELRTAGIPEVELLARMTGEVQARVIGILGQFVFQRAWGYWTVSGPVPLAIAEQLYAHPVGRQFVRVAGHCGRPEPKEWADPYGPSGDLHVMSYHIDTQEGLNLFVSAVRPHLTAHGAAKEVQA